ERMKCVAFSPDREWILAGDSNGVVTIWETATGRLLQQLRGHTDLVGRIAFSPDGRTLATASWDHTVKLWDPLCGREMRTLRDHEDWISCLAFPPDGNTLATGSFDAKIRLWEAATTAEISASLAQDRTLAEEQQKRHREELEVRRTHSGLEMTAAQLEI